MYKHNEHDNNIGNVDTLQNENLKQKEFAENNNLSSSDLIPSKEEIVKEIPLYGENYQVTKRTEEAKVHVEKKWVDSTKKIEVPIKYEEIFINGKEFSSMNENELVEVFSKIKEKLSEVFHQGEHKHSSDDSIKINNKDNTNNQKKNNEKYSDDLDIKFKDGKEIVVEKDREKGKKTFLNEKIVPLFSDSENSEEPQNTNNIQNEKVIPLWGEEVIVNKKMVKLGEIVIKKYMVNEKRSIDVEVRHEKLTAKYPHNTVEMS